MSDSPLQYLVHTAYADIGTQFNGVIGLSDMLASNIDTLSNEDNKELIDFLSSSLKDTYSVYHNLLIALTLTEHYIYIHKEVHKKGKVDQAKMPFPFAFFYLSEIISSVEKSFEKRTTAEGESIRIEHQNVSFYCNKRLITQLLSNLLSLSLKLSPKSKLYSRFEGYTVLFALNNAEKVAQLFDDYKQRGLDFLSNNLISKDLSDKISVLTSMAILELHSAKYERILFTPENIEIRIPIGEKNQIRIF